MFFCLSALGSANPTIPLCALGGCVPHKTLSRDPGWVWISGCREGLIATAVSWLFRSAMGVPAASVCLVSLAALPHMTAPVDPTVTQRAPFREVLIISSVGGLARCDCVSACNFDPLSRGIGVQN